MFKRFTKNDFIYFSGGNDPVCGGDGRGGKTFNGKGSGGRYILGGGDSGGRFIITDVSVDDKVKC